MQSSPPSPSSSTSLRIAVIIGSTRPSRRSGLVADWVLDQTRSHLGASAEVELVDIASFGLPLLDEPQPAAVGQYTHDHTRRWAECVASYDAFVFVTSEHNRSVPASLKNALDFVYAEWNDKVAGSVSLGLRGGISAAEHLRAILAEMRVASVRSQVALELFADFELSNALEVGSFTPRDHHRAVLVRMLDEIVAWAAALRTVRASRPVS